MHSIDAVTGVHASKWCADFEADADADADQSALPAVCMCVAVHV